MRALGLLALLLAPLSAVGADAPLAAAAGRLQLPALSQAKALAADAARVKPGPTRYALGSAVAASSAVTGGGDWRTLPDGRRQWRLEVSAPGARSLDFGFDRFRLPAGAELRLIGDGAVVGPITDAQNPRPGHGWWSPIVPGAQVTLELTVPAERVPFLRLELGTVHRGYRVLAPLLAKSVFDPAGSCNVDIACPDASSWGDQVHAVAALALSQIDTRDGLICTGQFVNNTAADLRPLLLTANHCGIHVDNADSVVAYFNFQNSSCRIPGTGSNADNGDGRLDVYLSGATMLAQSAAGTLAGDVVGSDFTLLEMAAAPPAEAGVFWGGWDRRDAAPSGGVDIHHPKGDEKRISIDFDPLKITGYLDAPGDTHLQVGNWDVGTTEAGSSGSALWDPQHRLVGWLSGGDAACVGDSADDNDLPDYFGRLASAWDGDSAERRLRDWLDPLGTGATTLDGRYASAPLAVTLSSPAFTTLAAAGDTITFSASVAGGAGPYSYAWDLDGDGDYERVGSDATVSVSYARRSALQVGVHVVGADGRSGSADRALDIAGPLLAAEAGTPSQICGNGDAQFDPGERWQLPVTLANVGDGALPAGTALFAAGSGDTALLRYGPDAFGHRAAVTDGAGDASCGYRFVDLAAGEFATSPLPLLVNPDTEMAADDTRTVDPIVLGGSGLSLYGRQYTAAVMSTNGYVAFDPDESGADYSNDCSGAPDGDATTPQLRPLHADLVVRADGGLYYRWFASCPRPGEAIGSDAGCHVFQWQHLAAYGFSGDLQGDYDFEAIVYDGSAEVVYQYRSADPDLLTPTIGLLDVAAGDRLDVACPARSAVRPAPERAVCIYRAQALPAALNQAAQLPQPAPRTATLAPAATTTVSLPLTIADDAGCGAPVTVDLIAAAAAGVHAFVDQPVLTGQVGDSCQPVTGCTAASAPLPRTGLFYDPARDGNGVDTLLLPLADGRNQFAGLWYTGSRDRRPTWYELNGQITGLGGPVDLVRFHNDGSPERLAVRASRAGDAWIGFDADGALLLAWRLDGIGGAERVERLPLPFASPNHSSAWYNPAESGWGLAIESYDLGGGHALEFIAVYLYDANGEPRWVTGTLEATSGGVFPLLGYAPQCPGCPRYSDVQQSAQPAGTLSLHYTGTTSALLDSAVTLPATWPGDWVRKDLPIVPVVAPAAR